MVTPVNADFNASDLRKNSPGGTRIPGIIDVRLRLVGGTHLTGSGSTLSIQDED